MPEEVTMTSTVQLPLTRQPLITRPPAPSPPPLTIAHARADGGRVLVLRGAVDVDNAPAMIAAFTRAARGDAAIAVDLSDTRAGDDNAMALIVNSIRRLHRRRADATLACPRGPLRTALEHTALARRLKLVDDPAALYGPGLEPDDRALAPAVVGGHLQRSSTPVRRGALLAEATIAMEERHPDPDLGLGDVAREIATSSRQLQRVFSEHAGSAFREDLAAMRMQHGALLLQTTDLRVAEVAQRVGYRQAAQFAKAFRRHHGISPTGLRRGRPG
jgi:AraC family transcriptional regulator of adaptative response / methylphosphotriester-DNA alkyltransferase methyltransferase